MRARTRAVILALTGAATLLTAARRAPGLEGPRDIRVLLADRFGFTTAQAAAVVRGDAVALVLPSTVDREIAVAGAVRVAAPAERLAEVVRNVERLESGEGFLHTRKLSSPPTLQDFDAFELPSDDVKALRKCRPGRCDVKLGQGAFDLLARVDWSAPDATTVVNTLARRIALDYVRAYQQGGNDTLAVYRDTNRPQFIAREFTDIVQRTSLLPETMPELARYLVEYPRAPRPDGLEDFFYWSMADFGLKPVFRLNHSVICPVPALDAPRYFAVTKQLYASHYFHTALEVRVAVDDPERPGRSHYLLTLNVARSDGLTGLFGGLVKSRARSGSREGLQKALEATRRLCERP